MTNEQQEPTPAEQRVLDAVIDCYLSDICPYGVKQCPDVLAALREYGAEQRAAEHRLLCGPCKKGHHCGRAKILQEARR